MTGMGRPKGPTDAMGAWDARYSGSAKEIEDHTIERCAQVADQKANSVYDGEMNVFGRTIAAAIRALKENDK